MDRAHHDLLGNGHGIDGLHSHGPAILSGTFFRGRRRSGIPARSHRLPHPLVPIRGSGQGSRFLLCRESSLLRDWLADRWFTPRYLVAWTERLEMAVYPGRDPRGRVRGDHDLLSDRLASAGSLAARGRAVLDHRTITARETSQEQSSSFLQHLGSSAQPGCNPADAMLFLRHDRKLRNRFLASHHPQTPLWTKRPEGDAAGGFAVRRCFHHPSMEWLAFRSTRIPTVT